MDKRIIFGIIAAIFSSFVLMSCEKINENAEIGGSEIVDNDDSANKDDNSENGEENVDPSPGTDDGEDDVNKEDAPDDNQEIPDDVIWDIAPVVYKINLIDAEGNNLLDPDCENSMDIELIEADYHGVTYVVSDGNQLQTKAYMPHFYGLKIEKLYFNPSYSSVFKDGNYLLFGELAGDVSYEYEELILRFGTGKEYVVSFSRAFSWVDGEPDIKHKWFLDGERVEDGIDIVQIVL